MAGYAVDGFRLGTVVEHALRVFGRNFVSFAVMAIVFYGASTAVESVLWSLVPHEELEAGGGPRTSFYGTTASLVVFVIVLIMSS